MRQLILITCIAAPLGAQWLKQPTPDVPRTAGGKPVLTAPAPKGPDGKPDLSGMWYINADTSVFGNLKPEEIQPSAAALLKQHLENLDNDSPQVTCVPQGPFYSYGRDEEPLKIVQTRNLIVILYPDLVYRQIFLDGRELPKDPNPSWMGYSIGHWEGDTLVVESSGFNDRTWLDRSGYPHSEDLRMTERFRRIDLGHMDLQVTFLDPKTYAKPLAVTAKMNAVFDTEPLEYVCAENEKDRLHMVNKALGEKDVPAAVLALYAGEYEAEPSPGDARPPGVLTVALKDGVLTITAGPIGSVALTPLSETTFAGLLGGTLEFGKNEQGEVTHFTLHVINADFRANRKK